MIPGPNREIMSLPRLKLKRFHLHLREADRNLLDSEGHLQKTQLKVLH